MCDQRLRDGWIPDSENWPILSSFFLCLFLCMGQSLRNPIRLFNLCAGCPTTHQWWPRSGCRRQVVGPASEIAFSFSSSCATINWGIINCAMNRPLRGKRKRRVVTRCHRSLFSFYIFSGRRLAGRVALAAQKM